MACKTDLYSRIRETGVPLLYTVHLGRQPASQPANACMHTPYLEHTKSRVEQVRSLAVRDQHGYQSSKGQALALSDFGPLLLAVGTGNFGRSLRALMANNGTIIIATTLSIIPIHVIPRTMAGRGQLTYRAHSA
jgi:hypothetical protein